MGGSASKPATTTAPTFAPDYSGATFSASEVQRQLAQASTQAATALQQATAPLQASVSSWKSTAFWGISVALIIGVLAVAGIILYDMFAPDSWPDIFFARNWNKPSAVDKSQILYISYAHYGTDNTSNYQDVTRVLDQMIVGETTLPAFTVTYQALGLSTDPYPSGKKTLYVEYYVGTSGYVLVQIDDGQQFPQLPENLPGKTPASFVKPTEKAAPPPTVGSRIYNAIFGDSSGDLAPSFHDASSSAVIQGNKAPLSSESEGGYGMQWWMYVKDWNYGYGKKKSVVKRPDATSGAVMNPEISLHPTDNTLQISVSVFPASEGGASKSTPAPAGHSGSTDDVFLCEVPNIPLQTWFSVSVTVFGRNLDVYIDGKLVKSCFLSGVPKPAVGDIQLTPEGGFSGRICGFYHYPRMLTPTDAQEFYNKGTSCKSKTEPGAASKATGYSVKFGVYDTLGKNVQEYTF